MLSDQEYFAQYEQALAQIYQANDDEQVFLKDHALRYRFVSDALLKFLGLATANLEGLTSSEVAMTFKLGDAENMEQFTRQDSQIQQNGKRNTFVEVVSCLGVPKIIIVNKTPVFNPSTGNFIGIRGEVSNLFWPHVTKTLFKIHGAKGLLIGKQAEGDPLQLYPLTNVLHTVLFLCIYNYSYSEIALLMSEFGHKITPIRVNDYLEQLKLIFHVRNKTQLIEKAIGLNFHLQLPYSLFAKYNSIEVCSDSAEIIAQS